MASSRRIESTAAAWLARREGDDWDAAAQARLEAWLQEATAHRVAYLRLQAAWTQSGRLKALGAGVAAGVIPERGHWSRPPFGAGEAAVAPMKEPSSIAHALPDLRNLTFAPRAPVRPAHRGRHAGAALALVVALAAGWGWQRQQAVEHASYLTAIGSLQTVPLSDGSSAVLSSDSRMQVALSRGERRIELDQGEAFFEVAKDPKRPFVVSVAGRQVVAVGTRFSVRRDGADLKVVVTEGIVRLESGTPGASRQTPTTLLQAGSVALATSKGLLVRTGSVEDAERQLDWRSGYLAFHDTPLADATAEFNRYNTRKILVADAEVGAMRVGGNFRWSNTDAFVRLLEQAFPVRAEQHPDRIVLHRQ
jgi:transmembrane sensor